MGSVVRLITFNEHEAWIAICHMRNVRDSLAMVYDRMLTEGKSTDPEWLRTVNEMKEMLKEATLNVTKWTFRANRLGVYYLQRRAARQGDPALMDKVLVGLGLL